MKRIKASPDILRDAFNIRDGVYAPVSRFLGKADLESVLLNTRLVDGSIWPIPIVLDVNQDQARELKGQDKVLLTDDNGASKVLLKDIEVYKYDKEEYARQVFGTADRDHPGVAELDQSGDYLVGGEIEWTNPERDDPYHYLTPEQVRQRFRDNGWKKVVAFQTRNIPHRSHEYLQKQALENADAIFIHPVIGKKKPGDFRDDLIFSGYEVLLEKYYPRGRYQLAGLPLKMRYAGPREAIMHALIRRNFGCTHMIIGRDHAGVGDFYKPFTAQENFDNFDPEELGIEILKFGEVKHCRECGGLNFVSECGHDPEAHIALSGTRIREMITNGEKLPEELIRSEISELLLDHPNPFV